MIDVYLIGLNMANVITDWSVKEKSCKKVKDQEELV